MCLLSRSYACLPASFSVLLCVSHPLTIKGSIAAFADGCLCLGAWWPSTEPSESYLGQRRMRSVMSGRCPSAVQVSNMHSGVAEELSPLAEKTKFSAVWSTGRSVYNSLWRKCNTSVCPQVFLPDHGQVLFPSLCMALVALGPAGRIFVSGLRVVCNWGVFSSFAGLHVWINQVSLLSSVVLRLQSSVWNDSPSPSILCKSLLYI